MLDGWKQKIKMVDENYLYIPSEELIFGSGLRVDKKAVKAIRKTMGG